MTDPNRDDLPDDLPEGLTEDLPTEDREEDARSSADVAEDVPAGEETQAPDASRELAVEDDPRSREELFSELIEAESRRDEYLEDVRRARAEFENYRKRVMREGAAQRDAGRAEVVAALLEVLDDLGRTLEAAAGSDDEALAKGVELVAGKLVRSLEGLGLERIDATAVPFDPGQHEAVQHRQVATDAATDAEAADREDARDGPVVVEVLRPGYRLGDRVLRPAMVVVEE